MPTYEYHCAQCKNQLEVMQKITEPPLHICPQCGHETLRRGPGGGIGVVFTGDSFSASSKRVESKPQSGKPPGCCPCKKSADSCSSNQS